MINLNSSPYDKITHVLISLAIAGVGLLFGCPSTGAAAAIGMFYGKEVSEHWNRIKANYPAGSARAWIEAYQPWKWPKGSQWDWYVVILAMLLVLAINQQMTL